MHRGGSSGIAPGIRNPGRFTPRKEPQYLLCRRLGGPQGRYGRVWRRENILPLPGFKPRNDQPVASRYTDWAIMASNETPGGREMDMFSSANDPVASSCGH
jgi:hypothetical protein